MGDIIACGIASGFIAIGGAAAIDVATICAAVLWWLCGAFSGLCGTRGAGAGAIAAGAICAFDASAWVIIARGVAAASLVLAELCIHSATDVSDALTSFTALGVFALDAITGVGFALASFAGLTSGACGARGDALAIDGAADFVVFALAVGAWVVNAFALDAELCAATRGPVATWWGADFVDADAIASAVAVMFAGLVAHALAVAIVGILGLALLASGALDPCAWVIDAGVSAADSSLFAGVFGALVLDALAVAADFASLAFDAITRIGDALAIEA